MAWLFLDFGYFCLLWICCVLDLLVPFIFSLSSYLCLDLTQIPFYQFHCVYLLVSCCFFPVFTESPVLHSLCWLFCFRKLFSLIRNFWFSGLCKIEVLKKRQKKNQLKRVNRKKMINILKAVCKSGRYSWRNWTLNLKNLLKQNGSCVWSETNARFYLRSWIFCI